MACMSTRSLETAAAGLSRTGDTLPDLADKAKGDNATCGKSPQNDTSTLDCGHRLGGPKIRGEGRGVGAADSSSALAGEPANILGSIGASTWRCRLLGDEGGSSACSAAMSSSAKAALPSSASSAASACCAARSAALGAKGDDGGVAGCGAESS